MSDLTKTDRKALEAMSASSRVNDKFMPATVQSLVKRGLAERVFSVMNYNRKYFAITEAGSRALKEKP